jgi:hypothetical protein
MHNSRYYVTNVETLVSVWHLRLVALASHVDNFPASLKEDVRLLQISHERLAV